MNVFVMLLNYVREKMHEKYYIEPVGEVESEWMRLPSLWAHFVCVNPQQQT